MGPDANTATDPATGKQATWPRQITPHIILPKDWTPSDLWKHIQIVEHIHEQQLNGKLITSPAASSSLQFDWAKLYEMTVTTLNHFDEIWDFISVPDKPRCRILGIDIQYVDTSSKRLFKDLTEPIPKVLQDFDADLHSFTTVMGIGQMKVVAGQFN